MIHRHNDTNPGAWKAFIEVMRSGEVFECDEGIWYYFLGVLPPVWMSRAMTFSGHGTVSTFGFAEGREKVVAFWEKDGRFYGKQTEEINPHW